MDEALSSISYQTRYQTILRQAIIYFHTSCTGMLVDASMQSRAVRPAVLHTSLPHAQSTTYKGCAHLLLLLTSHYMTSYIGVLCPISCQPVVRRLPCMVRREEVRRVSSQTVQLYLSALSAFFFIEEEDSVARM